MKFKGFKNESILLISISISILSLSCYFYYQQMKFQKQIKEKKNKEKDIFKLLEDKEINYNEILNLLNENVELVSQIDSKGRLLLHIEVMKQFPSYEIGNFKLLFLLSILICMIIIITFNIVELLLKLYPEGATIKDKFWQALPLHFLVHRDSSDFVDINVIKLVLSYYPLAVTIKDGANFLPIHRAGISFFHSRFLYLVLFFLFFDNFILVNRNHSNPEIIDLLLSVEPNGTDIPTSNGNTCLHWLLAQEYPRNKTDLIILEKVFNSNPSAIFTRNNDRKTPMEMLISSVASEESNLNQSNSSNVDENQYNASFILGHLLELVNNQNKIKK